MSTENPYLAGLSASVRYTSPAAVTAYTLGKVSAASTLAVVGTSDSESLVAGVWLDGRSAGDNSSVPFVSSRGVQIPMLSDGAGAIAAGDRVTRSSVTAGRVEKCTTGGIGIALSTAGATADALVSVLFIGALPTSGAGTYLPLAGGTMTGDITTASAGKIKSPSGASNLAFYDSAILISGGGMRPNATDASMGFGGWPWQVVETKNISTPLIVDYPITSNAIALPAQMFCEISTAGGLLKTIGNINALTNLDTFRVFVPTGAGGITWDATDNILNAGSAAQYTPIIGVYNRTLSKWYLK
jgi:hypothetical protein